MIQPSAAPGPGGNTPSSTAQVSKVKPRPASNRRKKAS